MATPQEAFWAGNFGDDYSLRNNQIDWRARIPFLASIIEQTGARSILDVGTNLGWNLRALREIDESLSLSGVDVNEQALAEASDAGLNVCKYAARDLSDLPLICDLAIHSGVLIHVPPADLQASMRAIIGTSRRYVLAIEYKAETPEEQTGARLSLDATGRFGYIAIPPERVEALQKTNPQLMPAQAPEPGAIAYAKVDLEADEILGLEFYAQDGEEGVPYRGQFHCLWKRPFGDLYQRLGLKFMASGDVTPGYDDCAWWLLSR